MATLEGLVARLRLELGDNAQSFQSRVISDGTSLLFNLPVELIEENGLRVFTVHAGVPSPLTAVTDYTLDARNGVVRLEEPVDSGDEFVVDGYNYETFLTEDLETFVASGFALHTHTVEETPDPTPELEYEDLPVGEEYLVVILAMLEALWAMITDAAQEIDVMTPDGVRIPEGQRYQQLLGMVSFWEARYKELSAAMGVGLYRIQMFTLRRISRTTNRLVPIYKAQEYDEVNRGFDPAFGPVGTWVTIHGKSLDNTISVAFNDTLAVEIVQVNSTTVRALVPAGATSGAITLITPGGAVSTNSTFQVGQPVPMISATAPRILPPIDRGLV